MLSQVLKPQYIPNHQDHCFLSSQQVQHIHECLRRGIPFNPAQTDQFVQIEEPQLPDFLYHFEEDEDLVPCFAMTNPYEAMLIHDPARTCVCVAPDMLHSFQQPTSLPSPSNSEIDLWYPQDTGKINLHQMTHWSIMSDNSSTTPWSNRKWLYGFF